MLFAAEGPPAEGPPSGEMFERYSNFFSKENLCHLLPKGLLSKGFLLKAFPLEKFLKDIQSFFKRKPVPFAAEWPPAEGPFAEGPPSGEILVQKNPKTVIHSAV